MADKNKGRVSAKQFPDGELIQIPDIATRLEKLFREAFEPRVNVARGMGKVICALDLRGLAGRANVEVWVKSSGADTFYIESSVDGVNWRPAGTIVLDAAGEKSDGFINARPLVRVRVETTNQVEIEVCGSR